MTFSHEERLFVIKRYYESRSYKVVRESFGKEFNKVINDKAIQRIVNKLEISYTLLDLPGKGRKSTITLEKQEEVHTQMTQNPTTSSRRLAKQVGLSHTTTYRLMRNNMYPYRISVKHELKPADYANRRAFCRWFLNFTHRSRTVLDLCFFSDEAWFHLSGYVNSQNYRIWSAENPHTYRETALHPEKIGVWCAMSRKRIVGPIFFTQTINTERYQAIIQDFVALLEEDERFAYFQQDGARAHVSVETMEFLREFFGDRIISQKAKHHWPARSPDLTPLDFFLWSYLKNKIYETPIANIEELKKKFRMKYHKFLLGL